MKRVHTSWRASTLSSLCLKQSQTACRRPRSTVPTPARHHSLTPLQAPPCLPQLLILTLQLWLHSLLTPKHLTDKLAARKQGPPHSTQAVCWAQTRGLTKGALTQHPGWPRLLLGGRRLVREVRERVDEVLAGGLHHRPCHLVGVLQLDAALQGSVGLGFRLCRCSYSSDDSGDIAAACWHKCIQMHIRLEHPAPHAHSSPAQEHQG